MVLLYHFRQHNFFPDNSFFRYAGMIICNGPLGVNVFFLISGFLITSLLIKENSKNGFISLKKFYIRRTIRIFPAYYFLLLVYYILTLVNYFKIDILGWIGILTYMKQFFPTDIHETAHLWSLSVEEVFYLIFPFLFVKAGKYLNKMLLGLIITVTVARFFLYAFPLPHMANTIFVTADALLIGCYMGANYDKFVAFVNRFSWIKYISPVVLVLSVLIYNYCYHLCVVNLTPATTLLTSFAYAFFGSIGLVTNLCIGLIVLTSITQKDYWYTLLNTKVFNYIGLLSYSIYLWQQLFTADREYLHKIPLIVICLIIFVCANISYYVIEKPFLKLRKRYGNA
jgi:peptidoglycan/LPS O-acetylase OafA/YrhL